MDELQSQEAKRFAITKNLMGKSGILIFEFGQFYCSKFLKVKLLVPQIWLKFAFNSLELVRKISKTKILFSPKQTEKWLTAFQTWKNVFKNEAFWGISNNPFSFFRVCKFWSTKIRSTFPLRGHEKPLNPQISNIGSKIRTHSLPFRKIGLFSQIHLPSTKFEVLPIKNIRIQMCLSLQVAIYVANPCLKVSKKFLRYQLQKLAIPKIAKPKKFAKICDSLKR